MINLLSLNVEGSRHKDLVLSFIDKESPDVISLYEAPTSLINQLTQRGYFTTFAPMCTHNPVAPNDTIGILMATKLPHTTTTHYYKSQNNRITPHDKHDAHSKSYPCVTASIVKDNQTYTITSTHLYDTWNGHETKEQTDCVTKLLGHLATLPPHILCGDFNMPRGYNTNYDRFTQIYTDEIPTIYQSSLDQSLHRAGKRTDLNAPIFDIYMVDYVFSMPEYEITNVTLEFGVSDHAAVLAQINKR